MPEYRDLELFADVHLEESFILAVSATPGALTFYLEAYILTTSPLWRKPAAGGAGWWLTAVLSFEGVSDLRWSDGQHPPATDATGAYDYGHIHSLIVEGNRWHIDSDAGELWLTAAGVDLVIDPPGP